LRRQFPIRLLNQRSDWLNSCKHDAWVEKVEDNENEFWRDSSVGGIDNYWEKYVKPRERECARTRVLSRHCARVAKLFKHRNPVNAYLQLGFAVGRFHAAVLRDKLGWENADLATRVLQLEDCLHMLAGNIQTRVAGLLGEHKKKAVNGEVYYDVKPQDAWTIVTYVQDAARAQAAHPPIVTVDATAPKVKRRRRRTKKHEAKQWHRKAVDYLKTAKGEIADADIARLCGVSPSVVSRDKIIRALRKSYVAKEPLKQLSKNS
jgi:hypothetical protein